MSYPSTTIAPGAQPLYFPGNDIGVLIVHGYAGSIGDYRDFAVQLNQHGLTVHGVCLAGHGQNLQTLRASHIADWQRSVDEGRAKLSSTCRSIIMIGGSIGGNLVLDSIHRKSDGILGVVTINTPLQFTNEKFLRIALKFFRLVSPYYPKLFTLSREEQRAGVH